MRNQYLTGGALLLALGVILPQVYHYVEGSALSLPLLAGNSPVFNPLLTGISPLASLPTVVAALIIAGILLFKLQSNILFNFSCSTKGVPTKTAVPGARVTKGLAMAGGTRR